MDIFSGLRKASGGALILAAGATAFAAAAAPDVGEQHLINTIKVHKTADGRSVAEVLATVEKQSRRRFKVSGYDVFYDQKGNPVEVSVLYWIGSKRAPDLVFVDLAYPVGRDGVIGKFNPDEHPILAALEKGVESFAAEVDHQYQADCPADTRMRSEHC